LRHRLLPVAVSATVIALALPALAQSVADRTALAAVEATLKRGDARAAAAQIGEIVARSPDWSDALILQARVALATRNGATAEAKLRAAVARGVPLDSVRHLLAHALLLQGRMADVREMARTDLIPAASAAYAARMRAAAATDRASAGRELDLAGRLAPNDSHIWSDAARFRLGGGDFGGAYAAAARAVELDPANVEALVLSGNLLRERYGLIAALPWYDRALAVEPGNLAAMLERAATLGDSGAAADSAAQIAVILIDYPGNPQALYLKAVATARRGDWAAAREIVYRIGDKMGDLPGVRLMSALGEMAQGTPEQAIARLRLLVDAQPRNIALRTLLARALLAAGDAAGARETIAPVANRPDADGYALTLMGRALERLGERRRAADYLDRAARSSRGSATPFGGLPAQAQAEAAARAAPGSPAAQITLGDVYAAQGQWRAAAAAYRTTANLRFTAPVALRLANALRRSGDGAAAAAVVETFRTQHPVDPVFAALSGEDALASEDWVNADALFTAAQRGGGIGDASLLSNLAWANGGRQRGGLARDLSRAAYALSPNTAPIAATAGWFAAESGDRAGGIALLEKAVAIAPDVAVYRTRLAQVRARP